MKTKQDNPIQTQQVLKLIKVEPGGNMKGFSLKIGSIQSANEITLLCKQLIINIVKIQPDRRQYPAQCS